MYRPIVYSLEQIRAFDTLYGWVDTLYGLAGLARNMLGKSSAAIQGFDATQTGSPSLTINYAQGWIYQLAPVDATVYGALPSNAEQVMQQGYGAAGQLTFNVADLTAGQSKWALVQVGFKSVDAIRAGDPNAGILPYINAAAPNLPFQGPNNSGLAQNTVRKGVADVQIKYGTPATTGSQVPPTPDANYSAYLLINLTSGQTGISQGQILLAGPSAYAGYQNAPYFPGVTGTIPGGTGSHHGGIAGQANKILLTQEVAGLLPYANMNVSNPSPPAVGGIVTVAGIIPIISQGSNNPNGLVAGQLNDMFFYIGLKIWYICTTAGNAAAAVWTPVGAGGVGQYVNTTPFNAATAGNFTYQMDTAGGNIVVNLPLASAFGGTSVTFDNIGSNLVTINPQAGETIGTLGAGLPYVLLPQNSITFSSRSGTGFYLSSAQLKYKPVAQSGSFTASGPSGTLYEITASALVSVTLPASPADGTILLFRLKPASGSNGLQFLTNGADTIIAAGTINGPGSTNPLTLPAWQNGPVQLCATAGGWFAM